MAQQLMETPKAPLNFVPAKEGEVLHLGTITIRIMEDGSRTGNISPLTLTWTCKDW